MMIQGFSDVSFARAGVRNDIVCDRQWGACFKLDGDVRSLFPYINGEVPGTRFSFRPFHVRFEHKSVQCTLYPNNAMAAPFKGREHGFAFIEELVVFLNDLHDRRHKLQPSYKLYRQPPSIVDILKVLPRTNCKACGQASCMAFAAALRKGQVTTTDCP